MMPPILIEMTGVARIPPGCKVAYAKEVELQGQRPYEGRLNCDQMIASGNQSNRFINGGTVTNNPSVAKKLN